MSYCTPESVRQLIKDDLLGSLLGDVYIDDPAEREAKALPFIQQAIEDAGAEIDGYLAKRYPVPFVSPPAVLAKYAKDIAAYNLVSRIGVGKDGDRESSYRERYRAAIRFLELIAKGTVDLGIAPPARPPAGGVQISGPPRLFSRESLKGM